MRRRAISLTVIVLLCSLYSLVLPSSLSASEECIAYSSLTDGYWQIWTIDPLSKKCTQITCTPRDKSRPQISPDSKIIVYQTANGQLWKVPISGGKEERILMQFDNGRDFSWAPDGKRVAFVRFRTDLVDDSDIIVCAPSGDNPKMITNDPGLQYNPAFSPNEDSLLYVSGKGPEGHDIWSINLKTGKKKCLSKGQYYNVHPQWSPDCARIAYASNIKGNYDIWLMDADGKKKKQLTVYEGLDTWPSWSPNGKRIAFASNRSGRLQIWVVDLESGDLNMLTDGKSACKDPSWQKTP